MAAPPVLILGAGINGAALARELVLNGVPVTVVDTGDLASGASAYSSRLIHGGLRYLEFAEFDLVRESLEERNRLLELAPQFVHPLRLFIPVTNRWGGLTTQALRFLRFPVKSSTRGRGRFVVQAGLWMYDRFARGDRLPPQSVHCVGDHDVPRVSPSAARWLCAYSDAQIPSAERFVLALLKDAEQIAREQGVAFELHTYHEALRFGDQIAIRSTQLPASPLQLNFAPAAIVNATGAWVDETLSRLRMPAQQLMGGTKGSHFVTFHAGLRSALAGGGIYSEAADGRPLFMLPFGTGTLVGTTDLPFQGDPAAAVATEAELAYLLAAVESVFPDQRLTRNDIANHYSGVRPLPYQSAASPSGITRRHLWHWHQGSKVPMVSLIGGKLTTCRAFAEQTVRELLPKIGRGVVATSRDRPIRGSASLLGASGNDAASLGDSLAAAALTAIREEWATTLEDLVERRLLLVFRPGLTRAMLTALAQILVAEGKLSATEIEEAVACCRQRLLTHFGYRVA